MHQTDQTSSGPLTFTPENLTLGGASAVTVSCKLAKSYFWAPTEFRKTTKCPVQANADWLFSVVWRSICYKTQRALTVDVFLFHNIFFHMYTWGSPQRLRSIEISFNDWTHYGNFSAEGGRCTDLYFVTVLWTMETAGRKWGKGLRVAQNCGQKNR